MPSLPTIEKDVEEKARRAPDHGAFDAPATGEKDPALADFFQRMGDDALILGQRLGEWCGHAPALEVDLSLANIALDLVGQGTHWLSLAGDADRLAFHRDVLAFRNCLLVEQPNGDFAQTIARQFLFSTAQVALFDGLTASAEPRLAEIAAKAVKEVRYHAELAADWVIRLGDGTEESRTRMIDGLDWFWRFVDEMFEMDATERKLAAEGIAVDRAMLRAGFDAQVNAVMHEATLPLPEYPRPVLGGRRGHHSEHLGHLLATMQFLPRTYPNAVW